jgi:hypothetical protein
MADMTKEQKLLALCGVLPVLGDFIEDLNDQRVFKQVIKQKANMLLEEIQRTDATILAGGNIDIYQQQIEIQLSFRQWVEQNF